MEQRMKELRKILKLSQAVFAEKIGLKQGTIADMERGRTTLTERNLGAICRVFNVNENWLRYGQGAMFKPPKELSYLDELAAEKGLDEREKALIQSIIDLPPSARGAVIDWALDLARKIGGTDRETEKERRLREIDEQRRKLDEEEARLTGTASSVEDTFSEVG